MGLALPSWPDACSGLQERETIVQLEDPDGDRLVTVSDTLCCADGGVAILTARVKGAWAPSPKRARHARRSAEDLSRTHYLRSHQHWSRGSWNPRTLAVTCMAISVSAIHRVFVGRLPDRSNGPRSKRASVVHFMLGKASDLCPSFCESHRCQANLAALHRGVTEDLADVLSKNKLASEGWPRRGSPLQAPLHSDGTPCITPQCQYESIASCVYKCTNDSHRCLHVCTPLCKREGQEEGSADLCSVTGLAWNYSVFSQRLLQSLYCEHCACVCDLEKVQLQDDINQFHCHRPQDLPLNVEMLDAAMAEQLHGAMSVPRHDSVKALVQLCESNKEVLVVPLTPLQHPGRKTHLFSVYTAASPTQQGFFWSGKTGRTIVTLHMDRLGSGR